jgi:hypothetical protein
VNVASRLESSSKGYGLPIIVGGGTAQACTELAFLPVDFDPAPWQAHGQPDPGASRRREAGEPTSLARARGGTWRAARSNRTKPESVWRLCAAAGGSHKELELGPIYEYYLAMHEGNIAEVLVPIEAAVY